MMKKIDQRYYEPLEQMMSVMHHYMGNEIKRIFNKSIYEVLPGKKILDLGCGTGKFLHNYYELGSSCLGVDIYNNFQIKNKKNYRLEHQETNKFLNSNKSKFDFIFLFEVLEHIGKKDRKILFNNLSKILNNNGLIFISTLNNNLISKFFSINVAENILSLLPKNTHDPKLFISPNELENLCRSVKLQLRNTQGISYNPLFKSFKLSNIDLINYFGTITI